MIHFVPDDRFPVLRAILAVLLAALGIVVAVAVYQRWRAVEQAARFGRPLPHTPLLLVMSGLLVAVGVLVLILVGWR